MLPRIVGGEEQAVLVAWGAAIRQHRQWKQLTRRELAARAGVSAVFLGEIERGQKDPSAHTLLLIARALGISLAELYLRVALRLDTAQSVVRDDQPALPLALREAGDEDPAGVPRAQDETAFELYRVARRLRTDQQVALLMLARSLAPPEE